MSNELTGFLFDIYNIEDLIYIWVIDKNQNLSLVKDFYYPVIYAEGSSEILNKLVRRLYELDALLREPLIVRKKHFYKNSLIDVLELVISKPSVLRKIKSKLFAFYGKMDIYHSDIDPVVGYLYSKNIYPIAPVRISCHKFNYVESITAIEPHETYEYEIPPLRTMYIYLKHSHRLGISEKNPVQLVVEKGLKKYRYELPAQNPSTMLTSLNQILQRENPDVILSHYGDQLIFPVFFGLAQKLEIPLNLDRDIVPSQRQIKLKGSSFNTYGSWIYRAPSYPLFGRWHIDAANSFIFKESRLLGIIELARISRLPVQKIARSSMGAALTSIETGMGIAKNYLIPWQKSERESSKTWYELLQKDKGGLVFQPQIQYGNVAENVAQLDFAQMYPSIMNFHNISPETINCPCCAEESDTEKVPELNYHICKKRRGVVSDSLYLVLDRRKYFKQKKIFSIGAEKKHAEIIVNSLKWINVVSFGYLGFRNAKFGKLESHESVTAFGRDKLLRAMEIAEASGFTLLHAITDCIFIRKADSSEISKMDLEKLCQNIFMETKVEMSIEGIFSWLLFCPSKTDPLLPVANRYMGRFTNGELKIRGIAARRKDIPLFIKSAQMDILKVMQRASRVDDLKLLHEEIFLIYINYDKLLQQQNIKWKDLLLRKTISRFADEYLVDNATALAIKKMKEKNINVQPGEKVKYLVTNQKSQKKTKRYLSEEEATLLNCDFIPFDTDFYRQLWFASYKEIWEHFAPAKFFKKTESELFDKQSELPFFS